MSGARAFCRRSLSAALFAAAAVAIPAYGQGRSGVPTSQPAPPPRTFTVPPAPPLSPQDEMRTFRVAPGFRVELVASEPLVHDPIALSFDPDGRPWVCEMRGFMPNVDARSEQGTAAGTISVLEDTDGDGTIDRSTVFLDHLVMPRGLCWTSDGLLVADDGKIWLCRDSDGDGRCDEKTVICEYLRGNLEHALNGLYPALDNWVYNAKEGVRLRRIDGRWVRDATLPRGQWGVCQDDRGYLVYNVNAQLLRGDLVPCYSPNAHFPNPLTNVALYADQQVWPIRPNTGINRGYMPQFLRPDGTMVEANADCGPVVYRGDNLPAELRGDVFISEPAGNLVRRQVLVTDAATGRRTSHNAYDHVEFIASTDERFRPVNMYNAPDGTLWLVDMYRGVIQHGAFMTPYLRTEILSRGLDKPIGMGRIYRIVHERTRPRPAPRLSKATPHELVECLASPNGWHRDMAQQLLVQRGDLSAVPALRKLATSGADPLGRLHALWTLEGLKKLDPALLAATIRDADPAVRAGAVHLGRNLATLQPDSAYTERVAAVAKDPDRNVRMQAAFTLGLLNTAAADRALAPLLKEAAADPGALESLLAGFGGRDVEFLAGRLALPTWDEPEPWRQQLLRMAAGLLWRQRQPAAVLRLLHLAGERADRHPWQAAALLEGLASPPPLPRVQRNPLIPQRTDAEAGAGLRVGLLTIPRVISLPAAPESLEKMRKSSDAALAAAAEKIAAKLNWPGKDGKPLPTLPPLSPEQQALYDLGHKEYLGLCAACHNPAGFGEAGKGPPLLDSDWLDRDERVIRLVLFGLRGPVPVNGELFNRDGVLEMPGMYQLLDDQKIAAILTYVRREWREGASPIEPGTVARVRAATKGRTEPWSAKELLDQ